MAKFDKGPTRWFPAWDGEISFTGIVRTQTQLPSTELYSRRELSFLPRGCLPSGMQKSLDGLHFDYPYEKEFIRFAQEEFSVVATRIHAFLSERVVGRCRDGRWRDRESLPRRFFPVFDFDTPRRVTVLLPFYIFNL